MQICKEKSWLPQSNYFILRVVLTENTVDEFILFWKCLIHFKIAETVIKFEDKGSMINRRQGQGNIFRDQTVIGISVEPSLKPKLHSYQKEVIF